MDTIPGLTGAEREVRCPLPWDLSKAVSVEEHDERELGAGDMELVPTAEFYRPPARALRG